MRSRQQFEDAIEDVKAKARQEIESLRDEQDSVEFSDILGKRFVGPGGQEFRASGVTRDTSMSGEPKITGRLVSKGEVDPNELRTDWKVQ